MVYGFGNCLYLKITALLPTFTQIKKVFDWRIGQEYIVDEELLVTCEGNELPRVSVDYEQRAISRACKAGLTNLVFENYRRQKMGLPIIPILFCIDVDGNKHPISSASITSKEKTLNEIVTHSELRRAYKLCHTFENEEIRRVAQESFKFVKVKVHAKSGKGAEYALEEAAAPWKSSDWEGKWAKRKKHGGSSKSNDFPWRKELTKLIDKFHDSLGIHSSKKSEREERKENVEHKKEGKEDHKAASKKEEEERIRIREEEMFKLDTEF